MRILTPSRVDAAIGCGPVFFFLSTMAILVSRWPSAKWLILPGWMLLMLAVLCAMYGLWRTERGLWMFAAFWAFFSGAMLGTFVFGLLRDFRFRSLVEAVRSGGALAAAAILAMQFALSIAVMRLNWRISRRGYTIEPSGGLRPRSFKWDAARISLGLAAGAAWIIFFLVQLVQSISAQDWMFAALSGAASVVLAWTAVRLVRRLYSALRAARRNDATGAL